MSMDGRGRVIPFERPKKQPSRWKLPTRQELADAADAASRTFLSLAMIAEIAAKILRAASNELGRRRNF